MSFFVNEMVKKNSVVGRFGVKFLDDYLLGIKKSDFIMIGAPTGTGKSNLAYQIAFDNAEKLNVHLFALEADNNEPYYRRLFSEYSRKLKEFHGKYSNYRDFSQGVITAPLLLEDVEKTLIEKYAKLKIHYKDSNFTLDTLHYKLSEIANNDRCDMIVLDHVDYFDILEYSSENIQVTEIMKQLRNINIEWGIPIILISHLRKKTNRKIKIPEIEDIFGTSNKAKQMKTVILLAPDYINTRADQGLFSTFFTIPKDRMFGGTHFIGQCTFNTHTGMYENKYGLMVSKDFGETAELYEGDMPKWAI